MLQKGKTCTIFTRVILFYHANGIKAQRLIALCGLSEEGGQFLIKRRRSPKIFFGWSTVIASGILGLWAYGFHGWGFTAFFKPIASELGFSRAVASVPTGIGRLEGGLEAPLAGWCTDKFGPRWIITSGVLIFGLSLILMNFIDSLWGFYIVWGVMLGTGLNIAVTTPIDTAISNWFVKKRGLALGVKTLFFGLAGMLVLPLVAWLITIQGWRMTCFIGGVVMWLVGLPLACFCFKQHRPEYYGLLPDGATGGEEAADANQVIDRGVKYATEVEEVEFTLRQSLRTPTFWIIIAAQAAQSMAMPAINIHGVPFLTDIGIDPLKAAGMVAMIAAASVPARLIGGFLADRVSRHHLRFLLAGALSLQAVGFAVFLLNQTIAMIYVWFILYGVGMGAAMAPIIAMRARYFGRKAFGSIQGISSAFQTPVGVVAPIYIGWVYDTTGNYITAFVLIAVLVAFATVLSAFAIPPKPPAQITDIRKIV